MFFQRIYSYNPAPLYEQLYKVVYQISPKLSLLREHAHHALSAVDLLLSPALSNFGFVGGVDLLTPYKPSVVHVAI